MHLLFQFSHQKYSQMGDSWLPKVPEILHQSYLMAEPLRFSLDLQELMQGELRLLIHVDYLMELEVCMMEVLMHSLFFVH